MREKQFIVKRREFVGIVYRAFGGRIHSYGEWRKVFASSDKDEAHKAAEKEYSKPGLFKVAIFHGGKKIKEL